LQVYGINRWNGEKHMGDHSSENYLDQLLNSMHGEETEHPKEQQAAKQVLRDDFEKQLFGEEETKEEKTVENEIKSL
jgi:hypothetical protein